MDQLQSSAHLQHQRQDLQSIRALGVDTVRYGMPWRLAEPIPGVYDWSLWDRALAACDSVGLESLVDLLHFGLPDFCEGFADPEWIAHFTRYVKAFLQRYPQIKYFTPVNEPCFTAIGSGYLGVWNERRASQEDFVKILVNTTQANLEALALIDADREAWWISAETFNVPVATTPELEEQAELQRQFGWLVWDLHLGLEPPPAMKEALKVVDPAQLARIETLALTGERRKRLLAGHDFYPNGVQQLGDKPVEIGVEQRIALYEQDARRWYQRYRVPFWISETSNFGLPVSEQSAWLDAFVKCIARMRADGIPLNGFCWYSRGDQYDWQTLMAEPSGQVTEVGLYDERRKPRKVAGEFAQLVARGVPALEPVAAEGEA